MRWPPLRWALPLLLAGMGLVTGLTSVGLEIRDARRTAREGILSRARVVGSLVSGVVEARLREGEVSRAQRAVESLAADRELDLAALVDSDERVMFSTRFAFEGAPVDTLGVETAAAARAVRRTEIVTVTTIDPQWAVGLLPVRLAAAPGELLPTGVGVFVLRYDLTRPLAVATRNGLRNGLLTGALVLALTVLLGLVFRAWVTRRAQHLVNAAQALAGGDLDTRIELSGADELAQVGRAVSHLGRDLKAKQDLEEQLRQAQKMEAVGTLAGGVAHDFNNILTAISGCVTFLLEQTSEDDLRHEDLVEIERSTGRAANLTRQLLAFSRRQVVQPELLSANTVLRDMEPMLARLVVGKVRLELELAPGLGAVMADAGQLERIMANLTLNALHAMPEGGLLRIVTEEVTVARDSPNLAAGRYVRISVLDTGTGIAEDVRERMFEPFFTTKGREHGTGLGLAMVHGIVRQAGGDVQATNRPRGGARIDIMLPRAGDAPRTERRGRDDGVGSPAGGHGELVLLVDDEPTVLSVTERLLKGLGYEVLAVSNATAAEELFRRRADEIDLLITDVLMPDIDGKTLARRLGEIRPQLPVLFISGYADAQTEELTTLRPQDAFLAKPIPADELARKVHAMLSREG